MANKNISNEGGPTSGYYVPGGAPSYVRTNVNMNIKDPATGNQATNAKKVAELKGISPSSIKTYTVDTKGSNITLPPSGDDDPPYNPPTNDYNPDNGGGSGVPNTNAGGGGNYFDNNSSQKETDYESKLLEQIKAELEAQKKALNDQAKTAYEQRLSQNTEAYEGNRNQINRNYMRTNSYLNQLYGDAVSGQGLSNRNRNYQNWNNNLTSNEKNYANNNATALADYNAALANNSGTYTQGLYNYVLPVWTNRQNYSDSLANQLKSQGLDYDYRKYLAELGLLG